MQSRSRLIQVRVIRAARFFWHVVCSSVFFDSCHLIETIALWGTITEDEYMDANAEVFVTLSADLLTRLRKVAQKEHVPLRWLVAGLICDTVDADRSTARATLGAMSAAAR